MRVRTAALLDEYAGVWYITPTAPEPDVVPKTLPGVPWATILGTKALMPFSTPKKFTP
jgi:hypothetical protein